MANFSGKDKILEDLIVPVSTTQPSYCSMILAVLTWVVITKHHRLGGFTNGNLLLTVLEVNSKIKVMVNSGPQ